ncbi:MAG: biotin/lipoate A/B protein ligase family protein [Chloroflexota bacterium]|nr:biotin/lipoate A/B protein ligase family protein [Chloroflexota bacterium]
MSDYPFATWRSLRSAPADGATNMAVDEAILRAVAAGRVPPTLRLYAWEPACLSLGRGQKSADVNLETLLTAGFGLVRRATGGKSILHVDELTYSVVAPEAEPRVVGSIVESYRRLSAGLVRGLERLGGAGVVADRRWRGRRLEGPVCFETPSNYEITFGGRKLVGSAQMRSRGVLLQHGALPLCGDVARICQFLVSHPDPARVRARATTVAATLGRPVSWSEAADAVAAGFAGALNLRLEPGALTEDERAWAEELWAEKYATDEWTRKV